MLKFWSVLMFALVIAGCGQTESDDATSDAPEATPAPDITEMAKDVRPGSKAPYVITPFEQSAEFPDAKLEFISYGNDVFSFKVTSDTYTLGEQTSDAAQKSCANSGDGQHIHLIVDTDPYLAKYEPIFEAKLDDGGHHVLAFLSRSYHESIKTKDAYVAFFAKTADGTFRGTGEITEPMLFYSRPKGVYQGKDTEKVMLDYYMINTNEGHMVKADINNQTFYFSEWIPRYIEGLPDGENMIRLTLLDKDGNPVDNPLNPVERKFVLEREPASN